MGYRIFRDQNTVVLEQGTAVIELPIVDSYFALNTGGTAYNIKTYKSMKSASIPRADIGTYSNELGILYTEESLLSFLRLYCSLTDKIPAPEPVTPLPLLPSGTYIPKNAVAGAFDLLWENQTTNVTTTDGSVENNVPTGGGFTEGASFKIDHFGDLELNFKFTGNNTICGLCYFKDIPSAGANGIEHSVILQGGFLYVYGNAITHYFTASTTADNYSITRTGNTIDYKINGTTIYSQTVDFVGGFLFNCAMQDAETIFDIEIIIP